MILKKMIKLRPKQIASVWVEEKPNQSLVHIQVGTIHKIHIFKKMDTALLNYIFTDRKAVIESFKQNGSRFMKTKDQQDIIIHMN